MKKQVLFLLLLAAMTPWAAQAQTYTNYNVKQTRQLAGTSFTSVQFTGYVNWYFTQVDGSAWLSVQDNEANGAGLEVYLPSSIFNGGYPYQNNSIPIEAGDKIQVTARSVGYSIYNRGIAAYATAISRISNSEANAQDATLSQLYYAHFPLSAERTKNDPYQYRLVRLQNLTVLKRFTTSAQEGWVVRDVNNVTDTIDLRPFLNLVVGQHINEVTALVLRDNVAGYCSLFVRQESDISAVEVHIESVPYLEDFESYTPETSWLNLPASYPNDVLPNNWTFLNRSTTTMAHTPPFAFLSSGAIFHSCHGNSLLLESETTPIYAILPRFEVDIKYLQLDFCFSGDSETLVVGYMTDPFDANTFTPVETYGDITDSPTVRFPYAPALSQIAFKFVGSEDDSNKIGLDNIIVDLICSPPDYTSVTPQLNSVIFDWSGGSGTYNVECRKVTGSHWSTKKTNYQGSFCIIDDLDEATNYQVRVQSVCEHNKSEWIVREFTTGNNPFALPYSEDFNSYNDMSSDPYGFMPLVGWKFLHRSTTLGYPRAYLASDPSFSVSGNCLFLEEETGGWGLIATLPEFEEDIADAQLTFTYRTYTSDASSEISLRVGYLAEDDEGFWAFYDVTTYMPSNTRNCVTVQFPNAPAGSRIAFEFLQTAGSRPAVVGIDNVVVEEIPTLPVLYGEYFDDYVAETDWTYTPENYPNDVLPDYWCFVNRSTDRNATPQAFLTSDERFCFTENSLFLNTTNDTIYAVLPKFEENLSHLQLSFAYKTWDSDYSDEFGTFAVGYMNPGNTGSNNTFVTLQTFEPSDVLTFETVTFSGVPANSRIAFVYKGVGSPLLHHCVSIDMVRVESKCVAPDYLKAYPYRNEVQLNWAHTSGIYNVEYKKVSDTEWTRYLTNYESDYTICFITDLEEATNYQVRVQSVCEDTTTEWITEEFTTKCSSFSLPYYCDFGDENDMNCWNVVNSYGGINEYEGNYFFTFVPTPTPPHYLISPEFDGSTAMLMSFHYLCPNYPQTIQVGYCTSNHYNSLYDDFIWGEEITIDDNNTWRLYEEEFPVGTKYIAIKHLSEWYLYLDDFSFEVPTSCDTPTNFTLNYHSQENQIWVNWDSNATLWNLDVNGSVFNVSSRPFVLSGNISQLTDYEVRVRTECEGYTHSPWSEPADFSCRYTITETETFTESFEGYTGTTYSEAGVIPYCWDSDSEGSVSPHIISSGSYCYVHNGTNTMYFKGEANTNSYLALRPFTNRLGDLKVSFWMQTESNSSGKLSLGYITADDVDYNTYTVIEEYANTFSSMVEHTTYLPDVPEEAVRLVFRWAYDGISWYGCCIDDISVELAPFCETLDVLSYDAETLTDSSVELSWTLIDEDQTQWDVQYATDERFTENVVTLRGVNSYENYLLSGLQAVTHYYVRVRANCGQSVSTWSNTVDFETKRPCTAAPEDLSVDNITAVSAVLGWDGTSDRYHIRYREVADASSGPVFTEEFPTNTLPDGWTLASGLLEDVMTDPANLGAPNNYYWRFTSQRVFGSYHAKVNTYLWFLKAWLITPEITLTANNALTFDLALTAADSENPIESTLGQAEDRFMVLITTDNGTTWNILREWNNKGSQYVYNRIATAGEHVSIDLNNYSGTVKLAFYAESTEYDSYEENDLHIDHVGVGPAVDEIPWQNVYRYTSPYTFTSLTPNTNYEAQVRGICGTIENNDWSDLVNFTTLSQITKEITGYNNGGSWYLIAPPFSGLNPADIEGMTTGDYDLYRFNPSIVDQEWRNYGITPFGLTVGKGYLYAHDENVTLTFTGTPYEGNEPVEVSLVYDATNERKCWNLVGNPFDCEATLDRSYYTLKADGTGINPEAVSAGTPIPPCTAVFVKAVAAGDKVVFSKVGR